MGNIVYKFRDWKIPFHKENLKEGILYFASPDQFNDPFDCLIIPRYDLLTVKQKRDKYRFMIRTDHPMISEKELRVEVNRWMSKNIFSPNGYFAYAENILKSKLNLYGIFSLSRIKNNILLWSHYSNSHYGFCIGYDEELLYNFVINAVKRIQIIADKRNVDYKEDYPVIIPDMNITPEEYIVKPLTTKSLDWKYEEEIRLILYDGANLKLKMIEREIIKEIILGCNIQKEDKEEIIQVAERLYPKAKLIQAKKHYEKFQLIFEQIN